MGVIYTRQSRVNGLHCGFKRKGDPDMKIDINNASHREQAVKMLREYCTKKGVSADAVLSNVAGIPAVVEAIYKEQNFFVRKMFDLGELTQLVVSNVDLLKKLV